MVATIRVLITGAAGRMGREMTKGLLKAKDIEIVGAVDKVEVGQDIGVLNHLPPVGITIEGDLEKALQQTRPQVMVDFTVPGAAMENAKLALARGVRPVIGTTGFTLKDIDELHHICESRQIGCVVAPNFSLGAVLMMHFSRLAARYFPHVEIIEMHHPQKLDAPSGTALKTAELVAASRTQEPDKPLSQETLAGVRGGVYQGIPIHSVRLPGAVAHQEVIFGAPGQILTLRHDTLSREAFLPGLLLAIREVVELKGLVYGLENLLKF